MLRLAATMTCIVAPCVHADLIELSVRLSSDGMDWMSDPRSFVTGQTVYCAIFANSDFSQGIHGIGGATLRLRGSGLESVDDVRFNAGAPDGRVAPFDAGAGANRIYRDAGGFRIDSTNDPLDRGSAFGMSFYQFDPARTPSGEFQRLFDDGGLGSMVFRFEIVLHSEASRRIDLSLDELSRGLASYHETAESRRPTTTSDVSMAGTSFLVNVPQPGTVVMLSMGMALTRRRR